MRVAPSRALYYSLRASSALFGLFLVSSSIFSFVFPDIAHSESQRPPWENNALDVAFLLYGLLLLVPYRWLMQPLLFAVVLLVFTLGAMWTVYVGLTGLVGLVQGSKSWVILPVSIIFVLLAMSAPAALVVRRRFDADMK